MKLLRIAKFQTPYGDVEFIPVSDVTGYSHRMIVNGLATQVWIPNATKFNEKTVTFIIRVWGALRDGLGKYHYADQNIDPPVLAA